MPFAACLSQSSDINHAIDQVCDDLSSQLDGKVPDLCCGFISHDHAENFEQVAGRVVQKLNCRALLGCTGETIVGGGNEIESGPAFSLWAGVLPGVTIEPFHVEFARTADGIVSSGLPTITEGHKRDANAVLLFGEPYSTDPNAIIEH
ncbi:MAG: FIST N-terminal domain-containing protein, partial [Planctomycetaceae bacterium]